MTDNAKLEPNDVVVFVKDFNQWGTSVGKKGEYGVVRDRDQNCPSIAVMDGRRYDVSREYVEKAQGTWKAASDSSVPVRAGSLVRFLRAAAGSYEVYPVGSMHHVESVSVSGAGLHLKRRNYPGTDVFPRSHFEVFLPESRDTSRVMTTAVALEYVKKFAELGQPVSIRSRSWDTQGRYAAVELRTVKPGGATLLADTFYKASECDAALARLEEAQPAVDVVARADGLYFRFKALNGEDIPAPDKTFRWSLADVATVKGVVRHKGTKYRLCHEVRTTQPMYTGS